MSSLVLAELPETPTPTIEGPAALLARVRRFSIQNALATTAAANAAAPAAPMIMPTSVLLPSALSLAF